MKRIISITIMFSMLFSSVGIVYADSDECIVRDPEMSIEELAYLDLDEAPAEMKDDIYNGPRELDHGIEKMREHGIMRLLKGRSANHVIQNVHVGIQGEGSH